MNTGSSKGSQKIKKVSDGSKDEKSKLNQTNSERPLKILFHQMYSINTHTHSQTNQPRCSTLLKNNNPKQPTLCQKQHAQHALQLNIPSILCGRNNTPSILCDRNNTPSILCDRNNTPSILCDRNNTPSILCDRNNMSSILCDRNNTPSILCDRNNTPSILWQKQHSQQTVWQKQHIKLCHRQMDISKPFFLCVNTPRPSNSATGKWTFQNPSSYVSTPQGRQIWSQDNEHFKTLLLMCKHPKAVKLCHRQTDISKPFLLCVNTPRPSNLVTSKCTFHNHSYYV